jgi:alpha-beta hydrolase superfamily lysophospholipase
VRTADGTELFVRRWPVPAGTPRRGSLLLVHGLGEHSGRYEHVAELLTGMGLEVRSYDHRGHGRSGGPRGAIPGPDALLDDLRDVFDALSADTDAEGPPLLLGHSMGGLVAARAATGGWVAPRALILSSPALALWMSRPQRALAAVGRRLAPDRAVANGLPLDGLSRDPAVIAAYGADEHVHDRITPRLLDFMLDAGARALADAPSFRVPTLLLVAGADRLVDAAGSRRFAAALPDGVGALRVYADHHHELFNEPEPDRSRVLDDLHEWIDAQLAQRGSVSA